MWPGLTLQIHVVILDVPQVSAGAASAPLWKKAQPQPGCRPAHWERTRASLRAALVQTRLLTSGVLLHAVKQIRLMCCRSAKQTV